jgi:hypothetical protein
MLMMAEMGSLIQHISPLYFTTKIELKKKSLSKFKHRDQPIRYATCLLRDNPGVNSFGMILTNGKDYIVGQAGWDSRGSTEFLFEKTVKQLGKDTISFWTAVASIAYNPTEFATVGVKFRGDRLYTKLVLEKVIGRGACSTVFRGRVTFGDESRLGKKYAVKVGLTKYIQREVEMKQLIEESFPPRMKRIVSPYHTLRTNTTRVNPSSFMTWPFRL